MTTVAYLDGFNLHYRALRPTGIRWVDPFRLVESVARVRPDRVEFFTARIRDVEDDPHRSARQGDYLRALEYRGVHVIEGEFRRDVKRKRLKGTVTPLLPRPSHAQVWIEQEKGSDVNLAAHLLRDALVGDLAHAVVVTNDSDQLLPVRFALEAGCRVTTVNPDRSIPTAFERLRSEFPSLDCRALRRSDLERSVMESPVRGPDGLRVHRPSEWES